MCGIAGFHGSGDVKVMLESIAHRGPDQEGCIVDGAFAIGCRRLAVIDIEGGRQPITNEDGSAAIVFNGEIFNYPEIRRELSGRHVFKTKTDTEVILHAWEEWGEKCLDKFNGMFAFAIRSGNKFFIARDRMGEKPLYYHIGPRGFFFASEIKAILTQVEGVVKPTPEFVAFEYPCGSDTYYENIKSLEPGCLLEYDAATSKLTTRRYWSVAVGSRERSRSDEEYAEELRALLKDAVAIRLRSDAPVGIFLSGGLDSALIAALAGPMAAFTCRFDGGEAFDEWRYAESAAKNAGLSPITVSPTPDDFKRDFPGIIWSLDGPISTMSSIGEFSLAKAAKGKVKVVLGGQGADELFGGYVRYLLMLAERDFTAKEPTRQYLPMAKKFWGQSFGDDPAARYFQLMSRTANPPAEALETMKRFFTNDASLLDKMALADIHLQLPALLTMNDRAAAAYGIENRCPFLDHRVVEFAFLLPEDAKVGGNRTKRVLRLAADGIVPREIVDRADKKGLVTPVGAWLEGPLSQWAESILGEKAVPQDSPLGIFDRSLYHRLSLKVWENVRASRLSPR